MKFFATGEILVEVYMIKKKMIQMPNSTLIVHGYVHVRRIDTKQNGNFFMSND
jgi:hypothetical protein